MTIRPIGQDERAEKKGSFARQFVERDAVLDSCPVIEPYFAELEQRALSTPAEVERWLIDFSELIACIDEVGTHRRVMMTCQTDDAERKRAFLDFIENIEPRLKFRCHALHVKYVDAPAARNLPPERYHVLDRAIRAAVEIFREANISLQTEEARLEQRFQEISGAQTVVFDGREQTLQELARYAEHVDRSIRQAAWEAEANRRLQDAETLDALFDELIVLRHRMAQNAGCADYREYAFKAKQRFDYSPQDCLAFHDAVERAAVPVFRDMQRRRRDALGVESLRPWDLAVDVKGRPPLRPFADADELCTKASRVFHRVHPALGAQFDEMRERGYLDLNSRKGKAPGGYQATYEESRRPFIFMNAVGVRRDVSTLIHEGGHAFHTYAARHDPLIAYRSSPIEFAEVASFGMELLTHDLLDEFYSGEDLARAQRVQLEGIIGLFPWVATIDAFQHGLYTHPGHSRAERREHWLSLHERFGGIADYSGHDEALAFGWQRQLHLYQAPFYYIEYGIAKLGALQVWERATNDFPGAVASYRHALALGGSRPLPELFEAAGARFDFSHAALAPLMELLQIRLEAIPV
jgi:oligoendopeptidase F